MMAQDRKAYFARYNKKNRARIKVYHAKWWKNNRARGLRICAKYRKEHPFYHATYRKTPRKLINRKQNLKYAQACYRYELLERYRIRRQQAKRKTLTHYGKNGTLCCCWRGCFVSDIDVLTLDHISNDGAIARRSGFPSGAIGCIRLERMGYPKRYQTLCANHQLKKEIQRKKKERIMELKIVSVTIDENGNSIVETDGFRGHGCEAIVKGIAAALGNSGAKINHKSEYSAPSLTQNKLQQKG